MEMGSGGFFRFEGIYRSFATEKKFMQESGGVEPGQILTINGPSGSGKSTLLRILARLIKPEAGEVFWHDRNWRSYSPTQWRRGIQFVGQKPVVFPGTIQENLKLPFTLKEQSNQGDMSMAKAEHYMEKVGLSTPMLAQEAKTMSGGEAARIALVRALIIEPEILLLDEPTAFLDQDSRHRVINLINEWVQENRRAAIIVSHQEEELQYLEHKIILHMPVRKAV